VWTADAGWSSVIHTVERVDLLGNGIHDFGGIRRDGPGDLRSVITHRFDDVRPCRANRG
jgi:hypothetical protein